MPDVPPRLEGANNFRDLAEINSHSPVSPRPGLLFRSELLDQISDKDLSIIEKLNINAICDLRHGVERARRQNRWPQTNQPRIIGDAPSEGLDTSQTNKLLARLNAPDFEAEEAMSVLRASYRRMPYTLAAALRSVFTHLLDKPGQPLLIHCTSGKDRSGFVCAMVLASLNVPMAVIERDYLLSKRRYPLEPIRQNLQSALGENIAPERMKVLIDIATVHPSYLAAAFAEIEEHLGGIDQFLAGEIGLAADQRDQLRQTLLLPTTTSEQQ